MKTLLILLALTAPAIAGDRGDDDQWFWNYQSTHSPRARQEAARTRDDAWAAQQEQAFRDADAANRHQEVLKELRAIRRSLGE